MALSKGKVLSGGLALAAALAVGGDLMAAEHLANYTWDSDMENVAPPKTTPGVDNYPQTIVYHHFASPQGSNLIKDIGGLDNALEMTTQDGDYAYFGAGLEGVATTWVDTQFGTAAA